LTAAFLHRLWQLLERSPVNRLAFRPILLALFVFCAGIGGIYLLGRREIEVRLNTTRLQLDQMRRQGDLGDRALLYADTWRMARDRLWCGWGLGAYGTVFPIYNTQRASEPWFPQPFYTHAHSDWLQTVAEVGVSGTALIMLLGAVPLAALRRNRLSVPLDPLAGYLFLGCALVALYAWVEFPFANPAVMSLFWLCFFVAVRHAVLDARATASASSCPNTTPFPS
jgi:O-antigen ligase